jgi:hypothetical protein
MTLRPWRLPALAAAAALLIAAGPLPAHADNTVVAGDAVTVVGSSSTLNLGTVCAGVPGSKTVAVAISKNGSYGSPNVFKVGTATVTAAVVSGSGLSANVGSGTITVPSTWPTAANNIETTAVPTTITVSTSTTGAFSGSVTLTATGASSKDGTELKRSVDLSVTANVATCNTPPTIAVDDVTLQGNTVGGRTLAFGDVGIASDAEDAGAPAVTCAPAIGSLLPLGANTVTCTATDSKGLTASDSGVVTVVDTTKPVISGTPSSMTLEATGAGGSVATFATPTASDVVWGAVDVTCDATSGSMFPLGNTTVTCTATDGSNNIQTSSFAVTVVDTIAPEFVQPADLTVEATSAAGAAVMFVAPVATDDVAGNITGSCSMTSGATFRLGDTTVTCTATDGSENTGRTAFVVHVVDTTPPVITVPGNMTIEATSGAGATVTFAASATDIVDGNLAVTCLPGSGSTFPLSTTTVSCSATDVAGNSATKTFTVTVEDKTPPTLSGLPADQTEEGNTAGGANAAFTAPTATDIVDPNPVVMCDHPESGFYPLGTTTVKCTATDFSGNVAEGTFTVTVEDTTPPGITWVSTQPNASWNNTDVTVTWSCSDAVGVRASQVSTTITSEGVDQSATGTCTDTSGNTASATVSGINIDKAAPVLNITGPSKDSTLELCSAGSVTKPTFAPTDALSGVATFRDAWTTPTTASGVGSYVYSATATDNAGNSVSESRTYKVVYGGSFAFAQPINSSGTSRFKLGSTVPVKFQLLCNGQPYSAAVAKLYVKAVDGTPDAGIDEAVSTAASTTGNLFRYSDGQYIFNLSTKAGYTDPSGATTAFVSGTYTLKVVLDDGTNWPVNIQLAK